MDEKEPAVTPRAGLPYEWEPILKRRFSVVHRMRIPGGWLYRTISTGPLGSPVSVAMVFVSIRDVRDDPENVRASL